MSEVLQIHGLPRFSLPANQLFPIRLLREIDIAHCGRHFRCSSDSRRAVQVRIDNPQFIIIMRVWGT